MCPIGSIILVQTGIPSLPLGRGPTAGAGGFGGCLTDRIRRQGVQGMVPARVQGGTFLFLPIGMWVGIGVRGLLPSPIGDLRPEVDNRGGRGRSAIAGASLRILIGQSAIAGTSLRTQVVIQEVVGIIGLMPTSRVPVMNGGLLEAEPAPTLRVPAIGEGLLELLRIVDRPQRRLQEGLPAVMAQTRQRFVPSMIPMTVGTRMLNSRV